MGLDRKDLVAELVQNDLDEEATRTVLSFEQESLVCEGNGKPVGFNGWKRLRKIQGAGDSVPAKRGKIGVKNHGLKTAFAIGDEIRLASAGKYIEQTLYADGRNNAPYPGASTKPILDPKAPAGGCRITISYRKRDIKPPHGEANELGAITEPEIDDLFHSACASIPEQFSGIVSPDAVSSYEIVLRHWQLGEARFLFSCTRLSKIGKRIEVFRRSCKVSGTVSSLPRDVREQAARRRVPLDGRLRHRAADFFRRRGYFLVEVSWPINQRGKPTIGTGRFRYPIGYPKDSHEGITGLGANFNAPFASDNMRHGPARNEATNTDLREACEALLIDAIARFGVPRWGPDGLNPLLSNSESEDTDSAIRPLLGTLAMRGALPLTNWRVATAMLFRRKKDRMAVARHACETPGFSKEARRYQFVLPVLTWKNDRVHPGLALLCPRSEKQLDPRTHPQIIRLLADTKTRGFTEDFITFDENDPIHRVTSEGNQWFGAISDAESEFSNTLVVRSYLDVIKQAFDEDKCNEDTENALLKALRIPDDLGRPTALTELYSSAPLPSDLPGLQLPPVLHTELVSHPIFRRRKWRREKYTMARFLGDGTLQNADEHTRKQFWQWLHQNTRRVAPRERSKLAGLRIWPDENGSLRRISELCDPRSRRVGTVIADSIHLPHEHVRRLKLVSSSPKTHTSIRSKPTQEEVAHWLDSKLAEFAVGEKPSAATTEKLSRFEADLVTLLRDVSVAPLFKAAKPALPALAADGTVQLRSALVMSSPSIDRLALSSHLLLKNKRRATWLDKLCPALGAPTPAMLLETFANDPSNFECLQSRLRQFLNAAPDADERLRLAKMRILWVNDQLRAPSELALTGFKGDYWGNWKIRTTVKGLSQDGQRHYLDAGVTSETPDPATSVAFFRWLAAQEQAVLESHIPCVLRQILHENGPKSWASAFTDIPFIPANGQAGTRLVSLQHARQGAVFLADAGDIADAIRRKDRHVLLAIDRVQELKEPVSEQLRDLGVKSLRERLQEPEVVTGTGGITPAPEDILASFQTLKSAAFKNTFHKRINELGIESALVRHDWHNRTCRVKAIRFADLVEAHYRFRRKHYTLAVDAGFDPTSGTFWMRHDQDVGPSKMYAGMAERLIFRPTARPIHFLALEHTVKLEIKAPTFGRPSAAPEQGDENTAEGVGRDQDAEDGAETDLGEAVFGHSPFEPDATRNVPNPKPIPSSVPGKSRPPVDRGMTQVSGGDRGDSGQKTALESKHVEVLKRDQYASHCQMCLCERPPNELAPPGSYIEWEEVRRRVVEAHHVDPKSGGGARHAGNIVLLCKLHHDNFGRRLTRADLTAALANATEFSVHFGFPSELVGRKIEIVIPDTGEVAQLFFTNEHADYWLSNLNKANWSQL